jgi:hypothetical protein
MNQDYTAPKFARDASGHLNFTTAQTTATIETVKTGYTIYVQRIIVWIKTDAAQSITFQDDNGTPKVVCKVPTSPGADTRWDFDFGPKGVPLTAAKSLTATFSAAGLAGHITWVGYQTDRF